MSRKLRPVHKANKNSPQYDGLFAWWPFDLQGGDLLYETERGFRGTLTGTDPANLWIADGDRGGVTLDFDGASYVDCGDVDAIDTVGTDAEFTWSVWVRIDSTASTQHIINKQGPTENAGFALRWDSTNGWTFRCGTSFGYTGTTGYVADTWYLLTAVYNGNLTGDSNRLKIYVDGENQSLTFSGTIPATITATATELLFGAQNTSETVPPPEFWEGGDIFSAMATPGNQMNGVMDDIRLYNRSLSSAEVKTIWNPQTRYELYGEDSAFPAIFAFTNAITGSGGILAGGSADEQFSDVIETSGGITCGGEATVTFIDYIDGTGGVICSFAPHVIQTNRTIGSLAEPVIYTFNGVTTGSTVVVAFSQETSATRTYTVSDDQSNDYTIYHNESDSRQAVIAYATNVTGGDLEITIDANFGVNIAYPVYIEITDCNFAIYDEFDNSVDTLTHHMAPIGEIDTQKYAIAIINSCHNSGTGSITTPTGYTDLSKTTIHLRAYKSSIQPLVDERGTYTIAQARRSAGQILAFNTDMEPFEQATYNPETTGGAVLGGAADVPLDDPIVEGGAVTGGAAEIEFTYNETGSGGSLANGSADETFTDLIEGTGGILAGGSPLLGEGITSDGGITVGGRRPKAHIFSVAIPGNGDGTVDVTIEGAGTPTAAYGFVSGALSDATTSGFAFSSGMWDGTNKICNIVYQQDNSVGVCDRKRNTTYFLERVTSSGSVQVVDIEAITDGIRLTHISGTSTNNSEASIIVFWDAPAFVQTFVPASTSPNTATSSTVSFAPDTVFANTVGINDNTSIQSNAIHSAGVAVKDSNQYCLITSGADGGQNTSTQCLSGKVASQVFNNVTTWEAQVTTWGEDSVTFTTNSGSTGGDVMDIMLMNLQGLSAVEGISSPTTVPNTNSVTGLNFAPHTIMSAICHASSYDADANSAIFGYGVGQRGESDYSVISGFAEDASNPSNTIGAHKTGIVTGRITDGGSFNLEADLDSWNTDGVTFNWTTNDVGTTQVGYAFFVGAEERTETQFIANIDATSGTVLGGTADVNSSGTEETTGGVVLGGAAIVLGTGDVFVEGGIVAGGAADITFSDNVDGTGGAVAGGAADVTLSDVVDATGGILGGGDSEIAITYNIETSGGVVANGTAEISGSGVINGDGGVVVGGAAEIDFADAIDGTGGVVAEGEAIVTTVIGDGKIIGDVVPLIIPQPIAQNRRPGTILNQQSTQADGLIGWWPSSYSGGSILYDLSSGVHGTLTNFDDPAWVADGERGHYVLDFDGTNAYVNCGNNPRLEITGNQLTLSAWFYLRSINNANIYIMNREGEYEIGVEQSSGELWYAIANTTPGWTKVLTGYVVPLNEWHLVTLVYNGSDIRTYIDGNLVDTESPASGNIGDFAPTNDQFWIGSRENNPGDVWDGHIDDVRVYDSALSANQVKQIWNPQTRYDLWIEPEISTVGILNIEDKGILAGGEADVSVERTLDATGGVVVNGDAQIDFVDIIETTGGVIVNGSADIAFIDYIDGTGGVVVNGTADITGGNDVIVSGGVVVGGAAELTFADAIDGTGGVVAGGSADEQFSDVIDATGGIVAGGESPIQAIYNIPVLEYDEGLNIYLSMEEGTGSTTTDQGIYGHDGTLSGATWDTTNTAPLPFSEQSSIHFNGETNFVRALKTDSNVVTISFWVYWENDGVGNNGFFQAQDGGTTPSNIGANKSLGGWVSASNGYVWGRVVDSVTQRNLPSTNPSTQLQENVWTHLAYRADGTNYELFMDGTAKTSVAYNGDIQVHDRIFIGIQGSGEAMLGNIDDFRVYNRVLSDTEIAGLAKGGDDSNATFASGSAELSYTSDVDTTGGVVVGGIAETTFVDYIDGTGGVVVNGTAIVQGAGDIVVEGGVVVGGSADEDFSDTIETDGGVVVDGTTNPEFTGNVNTDGGVVVNGSAETAFIDYIEGTGGVVVNGEGIATGANDIIAEGGAVLGGEALIDYTSNIDGESGVIVNGQHEQTFFDYVDGVGGVICNGHAPTDYTFDGEGGVVCSGSSFPYGDFIDETAQGGVVWGGSAEVTDDKVYILVECPEGYYVCAPKDEDAYCLKFINFISYGSPIFKEISKCPAKTAPITLCRQGVRNDEAYGIGATEDVVVAGTPSGVRSESQEDAEEQAYNLLDLPEFTMLSTVEINPTQMLKVRAVSSLKLNDFSPVRTTNIKKQEEPIVEEKTATISNLAAKAEFLRENKAGFTKRIRSYKARTPQGNLATNTPQMARLRKANEEIRNRKSTPEELRTVAYKRGDQPRKAPSVPDKPKTIYDAL